MILCIPARNEARELPALLAALAMLDPSHRPARACFFLDGCTDDSAGVLRHGAAAVPFPIDVSIGGGAEASAGAARRAAMAMGVERLGPVAGLLLTTDADSRPRADWIAAGVAALQVADVAAGRIVRRNGVADADQSRIERYYERLHAYRRRVDPVPWEARESHHFSSGANIAIHAAAYAAIDGFRPIPFAEDAVLLDDAARAGLRVRRDAAMVVETSSRRHGRAVQGLANALRALDVGRAPHVNHPAASAWQWQAQAAARVAYAAIDDGGVRTMLGERLGLSAEHVLGVARDCPNAEAFAMRIVPAAVDVTGEVTLAEAEDALAALEAGICEVAA